MRNILCDSRDDLIERLLQETTELRKENIKVWEKIKELEERREKIRLNICLKDVSV
jgi:hypothetical protein